MLRTFSAGLVASGILSSCIVILPAVTVGIICAAFGVFDPVKLLFAVQNDGSSNNQIASIATCLFVLIIAFKWAKWQWGSASMLLNCIDDVLEEPNNKKIKNGTVTWSRRFFNDQLNLMFYEICCSLLSFVLIYHGERIKVDLEILKPLKLVWSIVPIVFLTRALGLCLFLPFWGKQERAKNKAAKDNRPKNSGGSKQAEKKPEVSGDVDRKKDSQPSELPVVDASPPPPEYYLESEFNNPDIKAERCHCQGV